MFDFTAATLVYCVLVGMLFIGLWIYHDRRDYGRYEKARRRTAFHCIRCDATYGLPGASVELGECPKCGHRNSRLHF